MWKKIFTNLLICFISSFIFILCLKEGFDTFKDMVLAFSIFFSTLSLMTLYKKLARQSFLLFVISTIVLLGGIFVFYGIVLLLGLV